MSLSETVQRRPKAQSPPPGPFGFNIHEPLVPPFGSPYDAAPAAPPGPALLDDSESNMLDSFFTSMNSSQLDNNDFWFTFGDQTNGDTSFSFDLSDLPPTFEGSTTSLPSHQHSHGTEGMLSDKGNPLSSDIMAAASMLYQNGNDFSSTFSNQIYTDQGLEELNQNKSDSRNSYNVASGKGHGQGQEQLQLQQQRQPSPVQKNGTSIPSGFYANKMIFDSGSRPIDQSDLGKFGSLKWGSDSRFVGHGYQAPPDVPSLEERTTDLLQNLDCLEPQSSAGPTRAVSPSRRLPSRDRPDPPSANFNSMKLYTTVNDANRIDDNSRPAKRQKAKDRFKDEDEAIDVPIGAVSNHIPDDRRLSLSSDQNNLSRRSKVHGTTKAIRENLSEEQKRTNHILSEQKRRNLIKQGFEDLCNIVPQLRGGGYSKSTMLTQAAAWMEELLDGNELLRAQLTELKTQQGS